jgi:hypothetical protein
MKNCIGILVLFFIFSCSDNNTSLDKTIVLKIGKLEITNYEFERNKTRDLVINGTDSSALYNSAKLAVWKKNYINKCMIIADAYNKQYDTIKSIQKSIKHVGNYMMVQRYGYLWKQTISPIVDANKIVTDEKIEKRKKLFYFDYVASPNIEELVKLTNPDTIVHDKTDFFKIKKQYLQNNSLSAGYFSIQWPFLSFWKYRDYIYQMKKGSVSKPLLVGNNLMYLYLDHVEEITITDKEKANILTELQLGTEEELLAKGALDMKAQCQPNLNEPNIDIISQFLSKGNSITEFKDDIELIEYYINDTLRKKGSKDFIEYYSNLVMRDEIKDKERLRSYINEYYGDDYLINEAKKLNLYETDIFKLDQKNFQNNVLFGKYFENEIMKKIKVDSSEITKYYITNKPLFKQPKNIVASMYVFDKMSDAITNSNKIVEHLNRKELNNIKDITDIVGLNQLITNVKIDLENPGEYTKEIINTLLGTPSGRIAQRPVSYQNKYIVLFKHEESGESVKKLKDASDFIVYRLKESKAELDRQALVSQLKTRYKIELDKTGIPD